MMLISTQSMAVNRTAKIIRVVRTLPDSTPDTAAFTGSRFWIVQG